MRNYSDLTGLTFGKLTVISKNTFIKKKAQFVIIAYVFVVIIEYVLQVNLIMGKQKAVLV